MDTYLYIPRRNVRGKATNRLLTRFMSPANSEDIAPPLREGKHRCKYMRHCSIIRVTSINQSNIIKDVINTYYEMHMAPIQRVKYYKYLSWKAKLIVLEYIRRINIMCKS